MNRGLGSDDADCDRVKNVDDNCVIVFNPRQEKTRPGEYGDACNPKLKNSKKKDLRCDEDTDGTLDDDDNCPLIANPDQKDSDCDGLGDFCDETPSGAGTNKCARKSKRSSSARNRRTR